MAKSKRNPSGKPKKLQPRRVAKKVVRSQLVPVSGVPRHNASMLSNASAGGHRDTTKEAVTAFLQPFQAYEARLMPGLPVSGSNQAAYGFWTRNVVTFTDVAYVGAANVGSWVSVAPWDMNQIVIASTFSDSLGTPDTFDVHADPFYASMATNFEAVVVGYQGVRVKNLTAVLDMSGESFVGRYPVADMSRGYVAHRTAGTNFVKSSSDPGVMLTLNYEGQTGIVPAVAGTVVDYGWLPPATVNQDSASTRTLFRSQAGAGKNQTWEVEVVTYYLARPYASASAFFSPVKREVDLVAFDRAVDRAVALSPELSIARNALKDDGEDPTLMEDLESIWGGAKSFARVAQSAWSGLSSFFGLSLERRAAIHLQLFASQRDYDDLLTLMQKHDMASLREHIDRAIAPPSFTPAQMAAIRALILEEEKEDSFEHLTTPPKPAIAVQRFR